MSPFVIEERVPERVTLALQARKEKDFSLEARQRLVYPSRDR